MDTPPITATMPANTQAVLLGVTILSTIVVLAWSLYVWRRKHDVVPLLIAVGSLLVIFYEPLGDSLLGAYYPEQGQITAVHAFGRDMPLFVLLLYPPYFVPFAAAFLALVRKGFTARSWWTLWLVTLVSGAAMEAVLMHFGHPWLYYGQQTLELAGFPCWVAFTNVTFLFATGAVAHLINTRLSARHRWLIAPAVPLMTIAGHAAVALPGAATREYDSDLLMLTGGLGSIAVAATISYGLSLGFLRDTRPPTAGPPRGSPSSASATEPSQPDRATAPVATLSGKPRGLSDLGNPGPSGDRHGRYLPKGERTT